MKTRDSRVFYGWVIVAFAFVAQFVVTGAVIQCFPVFLLPLSEEFAIGRAEASFPIVAMLLCGILISPLVGRAVARFSIRNVMLAGALGMALGFFGLSRATAWWQVLALYGSAGAFSMAALGPVSCNSIVVNWFQRQRAMALGIAMIGMSISGAVLIPLATWVLTNWGWRAVYMAFGWVAVALMPFIAWLAVSRPADMGLAQDGDAPAPPRVFAAEPVATSVAPASTRDLLGSKALWLIAATGGLIFLGSLGIMNHGFAFAVDRGIDPLRAAVLLSAISIGAACGKLVFGWLADQLGDRGGFYVAIACQLVALSGLIALSSYAPLVASAGVYGLGIGGVAPLQAAMLARMFRARDFGPVMGLIGPLMIPFQVAGPPLAGWIFDARGSYDLALWIFLGTSAASALVISLVRLPPRDTESASDSRTSTRGVPAPLAKAQLP